MKPKTVGANRTMSMDDYSFELRKAIGQIHFLTGALPEYPHEIGETEVAGVVSILDGVEQMLLEIRDGLFGEEAGATLPVTQGGSHE